MRSRVAIDKDLLPKLSLSWTFLWCRFLEFRDMRCRSPFEKTLFLPVRNVTRCASRDDTRTAFQFGLRRLLSRPGLTTAATRSAAEGMGGAEPPAVTRSAYFGASMARTASTRPSLERAPWHARLRLEEQAASVVCQGSTLPPHALPPPQPRPRAFLTGRKSVFSNGERHTRQFAFGGPNPQLLRCAHTSGRRCSPVAL
jgi:hypothetical protein